MLVKIIESLLNFEHNGQEKNANVFWRLFSLGHYWWASKNGFPFKHVRANKKVKKRNAREEKRKKKSSNAPENRKKKKGVWNL